MSATIRTAISLLLLAAPTVTSAQAPPEASVDFRISRLDLDCLVDTSGSLLGRSEPIVFSPDMCIGAAKLQALLSGSKRTSLPNRKASLPNRRSTTAKEATSPRLIFTRKTLTCLVGRARANALPAGDPIHVDLRTCA